MCSKLLIIVLQMFIHNTVTAIDMTLQVYQNSFVMVLDPPMSFGVKSNKFASCLFSLGR